MPKTLQDHSFNLEKLKEAQDADHDNREAAREADLFVSKRDGQWEPYWWDANEGQPRYTFDLTSPIIDQIAGAMEESDFDVAAKPASGDASKDTAEIYDGLIRNIQTISNAGDIYDDSSRSMVTTGLSGWRVVQEFVDSNSFDQDLLIEAVPNFIDRVWFGPHEKRDASDCKMAWVLNGFTKDEYEKRWPKGSAQGVTQDAQSEAYFHRQDLIMVGELMYIKETEQELVMMTSGQVYENNEDFKLIEDELLGLGQTVKERRKRKKNTVFTRLFDASDWLGEEQKTVFEWIPVIPEYANWKVIENKIIYFGAVEKMIDPQRVFNYSQSREVAEGALAPRAKYWMTEKQSEGHEEDLATLNTNNHPVQKYNADAEAPGAPQQNGGAIINQGLRTTTESMRTIMGQTAGMFAANMGENPGLQSGVAIDSLKDTGNTGNSKYFKAREIAQCHTGRILINAIPKVYGKDRQVRLLKDDGSFDMQTLNQSIIDAGTLQEVVLNDLSVGTYDVTCTSGPSFKNKQSETVAAVLEVSAVDPTVMQIGSDVMLNNITAPGISKIADRKRAQLFQAGMIPQDQWTDEEQQQVQQQQEQAAQQPPVEDPNLVLARAEETKGQADLITAQNAETRTQVEVQVKSAEIQLNQQKEQREMLALQHKIQMDNQKLEIEGDKAGLAELVASQKLQMDAINQQAAQTQAVFDQLQQQAETLKTIREAYGVDSIVGPHTLPTFVEGAEQLSEAQDNIPE